MSEEIENLARMLVDMATQQTDPPSELALAIAQRALGLSLCTSAVNIAYVLEIYSSWRRGQS